jgi:hypothetical protein
MKSKTTEVKSSTMSKRSTVSGKKSSSIGDEIYEKYNINERLIKLIDGDENKIKILLKEIYKHKKEEMKELSMTPYTKENENESILRI